MGDPSRSEERDGDLVRRFLSGDPGGFEELLRRYGKPVFNFIRRFLGDPEGARDVFQETMVGVLRSLDRYDRSRPFLPWAMGIAVNRCHEERRRKAHAAGEGSAAEVPEPAERSSDPARSAEERETAERIAAAVGSLDDAHRAVFVFRIYHGLTYGQIGEILNISEGTAKSRMHYAVFNVRKILGMG
jgi:RNA polymerase sigma factor (sigma-70 family)